MNPEEFALTLNHAWDMDLWFGRGLDRREQHPAGMDWLIPYEDDVRGLKWATRRE